MNRKLVIVSLSLAGLSTGACDDPTVPRPPSLGTQIDRMARAGVNTAVTDRFTSIEVHDAAAEVYNQASNPAQWASLFAAEFAGSLAIYDSLDTVCGNQLLAGPAATPGRYAAFAGVLADDRLYVNTASGSCQQYLAVEANALGIVNADCGGRTPLYDTINVTYSLFAIGALGGVSDGIDSNAEGAASLTDFPFFLAPN